MRNVQAWLSARAENVAAILLAGLFGVFIVQIVSRYVFNHPVGWALEVCLTLWLWLVLWGAAFCLDDKDHVRFDILLEAARPQVRRLFAVVSAIAIVAGLLAALPATYDYVSFYKVKKSATLRIRLDVVFSVYLIFAVAVIARYAWRALAIMRAGSGDGGNESSAS